MALQAMPTAGRRLMILKTNLRNGIIILVVD